MSSKITVRVLKSGTHVADYELLPWGYLKAGRSPRRDIHLDSEEVARTAVTFYREHDRVDVRRRGWKFNAELRLDGNAIKKAWVSDNRTLEIGDFRLQLVFG